MKNIWVGFIGKKIAACAVTALLLVCSISIASATTTTISLINLDGPGEGFNDPSAAVPNQTGNTGSSLGQQRINVFLAAAEFWQARLVSPVEIRIDINMDPLDCDAFGAVLGSAGPQNAFANFPNAPLDDVAYVVATANSLAGFDLDTIRSDITARFNVDIDNNNQCLFGTNWWLGINTPAPPGTISLYDTVLHEIGHGLGVSSLVALSPIPEIGIEAGDFFSSVPTIYALNLRDESLGMNWDQITSAQRVASSTNTGNLVWRGDSATNNSDHLEVASRTNGRIRIYAPSPVELGSSVSHWDTVLTPDELMEPFATETSDERSTLQMLEDVGWEVLDAGVVNFVSSTASVSEDIGFATISVERVGATSGAVTVVVSSSDITATGGVDYDVTNQVLTWEDGEDGVRDITVPIANDDIEELGSETALFSLSDPTGDLVIGIQDTFTLSIRDPDDGFLLNLIPAILSGVRDSE